MKNIGSKIVIVGVSASGKSTLSRKLAEKTNLPLVLMDELMWSPGWEYVGDEKILELLLEEIKKENWIIEGYITKEARSVIFEKADTIIYLDYSPYLLVWRYVKRFLQHRKNPRPELQGSPEKFNQIILVSGDGDYKMLVDFLIEEKKFKKILFPNRKFASSLYKSLGRKYFAYLEESKNKIEN